MSKPGKRGLARFIAATGYSCKGLAAAWRYEEAFRIEAILGLICLPLAWFLAGNHMEFILLVSAVFWVWMAELGNSAVEAMVDRIGSEQHELSGRAKDIGSSVVLVSLVLFAIVWGSVIIHRLSV